MKRLQLKRLQLGYYYSFSMIKIRSAVFLILARREWRLWESTEAVYAGSLELAPLVRSHYVQQMDSMEENRLLLTVCKRHSGLRSVICSIVGYLVVMSGVGNAQDFFEEEFLSFPKPAPVIPLATDVKHSTSVSVSKQFVVHGPSLAMRSAFSKFAESVKGDFLDLLFSTGRGSHPERIDQWKNQIVIQIRDDAADPVLGSVTSRIQQVVPEGFRLEVTARIGTALDRDELREELIRLLLAEAILRDHKAVRTGGRAELLPRWLMAGVTEILRQKVHGRPSDLYEKVFQTGSVLSVDEILSAQPDELDSLSEKMFELSSAGLIQTLLEQLSGANRMRSFISELAINPGPQRELLLKHFPGLRASRNSLEKWWALQMATMSEPGVFEWMTAEETELALDGALQVEFEVPVKAVPEPSVSTVKKRKPSLTARVRSLFGGGSARVVAPSGEEEDDLAESKSTETIDAPVKTKIVTCRIEDLDLYLGNENLPAILQKEQADLARIVSRAHPLFRAVILDYQATIGRLTAESDIPAAVSEFAELVARRTVIQRQAEAIADHLNWYEATQMDSLSGKFEGFFETIDAMDSDLRRRRSDPISQYLDSLQQEFRR